MEPIPVPTPAPTPPPTPAATNESSSEEPEKIITGSISFTSGDPDALAQDLNFIAAVTTAIADMANVQEDRLEVVLSVRRRLAAAFVEVRRRLGTGIEAQYTIRVPAGSSSPSAEDIAASMTAVTPTSFRAAMQRAVEATGQDWSAMSAQFTVSDLAAPTVVTVQPTKAAEETALLSGGMMLIIVIAGGSVVVLIGLIVTICCCRRGRCQCCRRSMASLYAKKATMPEEYAATMPEEYGNTLRAACNWAATHQSSQRASRARSESTLAHSGCTAVVNLGSPC